MNRRCIPSISLSKSNNHEGFFFIKLYSGKILNSYEWTELHIDNNSIEKFKKLSSDLKGLLVKYKYQLFEWSPGISILY